VTTDESVSLDESLATVRLFHIVACHLGLCDPYRLFVAGMLALVIVGIILFVELMIKERRRK